MVAVVEDIDRLALEDIAREQEQRHVRASPGSVHGEESQARGRQLEERRVGVRHELVGALAGGVQRHRMIGGVVLRERHVGVGAVYRAGRGVHQVLDAVVAAAFQHVEGAGDVAAHVGVWVLERMAHAGLRREVHHALKFLAREERGHGRLVGEVELHEAKLRLHREAREARLLERNVVVLIQVIETDHLVTAREQPLGRVRADEAGGAGQENFHRRPSTAAAGNTCLMSYSTCFALHSLRTPRAPSSRNCRCATATIATS